MIQRWAHHPRVAGRLVFAAMLLAACTADESSNSEPGVRTEGARRWLAVRWDTVFRAGGSAYDTLLELPTRLAADEDGVSVLDPAAGRVLRFARDGRLAWIFGRPGRGPDEFRRPRDIKLDRYGRSWVLDPGNARLVGIDPTGSSSVGISLMALQRPADSFVPWPSGGALLVTLDRQLPLVRVAATGEVIERSGLPWRGVDSLHPLAAQLVVGNDPKTDRWAAAFGLGDGFFAFRGMEGSRERWRYVESAEFARIEEHLTVTPARSERVSRVRESRFTAEAVSVCQDRVFVFFGGRSADRNRLIDVYTASDGLYRGSLRLPTHPRWAVIAGGLVYALYEDPYPTVAAWRPKEQEAICAF